ncbi:MucBP domain-containing protein [Streptococcus halotolerans]|uniref:MucBP domain-containing protein n=1 Tax=Streptococcus halotolerans TaxID=1814128 RepID=UPI000787DFBB|nr:MucBP domain-containing protein [Streptococcus halotolerans]
MFFKQKQRFSIRKYSFGAASVLLGTVLLGLAGPDASANTLTKDEQTTSAVSAPTPEKDPVGQSEADATETEVAAPDAQTAEQSDTEATADTTATDTATTEEATTEEEAALADTATAEEAKAPVATAEPAAPAAPASPEVVTPAAPVAPSSAPTTEPTSAPSATEAAPADKDSQTLAAELEALKVKTEAAISSYDLLSDAVKASYVARLKETTDLAVLELLAKEAKKAQKRAEAFPEQGQSATPMTGFRAITQPQPAALVAPTAEEVLDKDGWEKLGRFSNKPGIFYVQKSGTVNGNTSTDKVTTIYEVDTNTGNIVAVSKDDFEKGGTLYENLEQLAKEQGFDYTYKSINALGLSNDGRYAYALGFSSDINVNDRTTINAIYRYDMQTQKWSIASNASEWPEGIGLMKTNAWTAGAVNPKDGKYYFGTLTLRDDPSFSQVAPRDQADYLKKRDAGEFDLYFRMWSFDPATGKVAHAGYFDTGLVKSGKFDKKESYFVNTGKVDGQESYVVGNDIAFDTEGNMKMIMNQFNTSNYYTYSIKQADFDAAAGKNDKYAKHNGTLSETIPIYTDVSEIKHGDNEAAQRENGATTGGLAVDANGDLFFHSRQGKVGKILNGSSVGGLIPTVKAPANTATWGDAASIRGTVGTGNVYREYYIKGTDTILSGTIGTIENFKFVPSLQTTAGKDTIEKDQALYHEYDAKSGRPEVIRAADGTVYRYVGMKAGSDQETGIVKKEDQTVKYEYEPVAITGDVVVKYVDVNGNTIKDPIEDEKNADAGTPYNTDVDRKLDLIKGKDGKTYELVTAGEYEVGEVDDNGHLTSSDETTGKVEPGTTKEVTYVYREVPTQKTGDVVLHYVDTNGNELLPNHHNTDDKPVNTDYTVTASEKPETIEKDGVTYKKVEVSKTGKVGDKIVASENVTTEESGKVTDGTKNIVYVYKPVGSVLIHYVNTKGQVIKEVVKDITEGDLDTAYDATETKETGEEKPQTIVKDGVLYHFKEVANSNIVGTTTVVPTNETNVVGKQTGSIVPGTTHVIYVYEQEVPVPTPPEEVKKGSVTVKYEDTEGNQIKDPVKDTDNEPVGTKYETTDNRDEKVKGNDGSTYYITEKAVKDGSDPEKGEVEEREKVVTYVYEKAGAVEVKYVDENGTEIKTTVEAVKDAKPGSDYNVTTTDLRPQTITNGDKKYELVPVGDYTVGKVDENGRLTTTDAVNGQVEAGKTKSITYVYREVKEEVPTPPEETKVGSVAVEYVDVNGKTIRDIAFDEKNQPDGTPYNTADDHRPKAIVGDDGKVYEIVKQSAEYPVGQVNENGVLTHAAEGQGFGTDSEEGTVTGGETKRVTYVYKLKEEPQTPPEEVKKGSVTVKYEDTEGNQIKEPVKDTDNEPVGTRYETTDNKHDKVKGGDGSTYYITEKAVKDGSDEEKGLVEEREKVVTYVYEKAGAVEVKYVDENGTEIKTTVEAVKDAKPGSDYNVTTTDLRPQTITNGDKKYELVPLGDYTVGKVDEDGRLTTTDAVNGQVEAGKTKSITYVYREVKEEVPTPPEEVKKGSVTVKYEDTEGNQIKDPVKDTDNEPVGTKYETTDNKHDKVKGDDGSTYYITEKAVKDGSDPEKGEVEEGDKVVTYVYEKAGAVEVKYVDETGKEIKATVEAVKDAKPGSDYDTTTTTLRPSKITGTDGKVYELVSADDYTVGTVDENGRLTTTDAVNGQVEAGKTKSITYVYKLREEVPTPPEAPKTGSVVVHYVNTDGEVIQSAYKDTVDAPVDSPYNAAEGDLEKPKEIRFGGKTYQFKEVTNSGVVNNKVIVPKSDTDFIGPEADKVLAGTTHVVYVYEEVKEETPTPPEAPKYGSVIVHYKDEEGNTIAEDKVDTQDSKEGTPYDTTDNRQEKITTPDGKTYERTPKVEGEEKGTVTEGTTEVTYVYKEVKGDVEVHYIDTDGNVLQDPRIDTPESSTGTPYNTGENDTEKPQTITKDGVKYELVPHLTQGNETGKVVEGTTKVTYVYKKVEEPTTPEVPEEKPGKYIPYVPQDPSNPKDPNDPLTPPTNPNGDPVDPVDYDDTPEDPSNNPPLPHVPGYQPKDPNDPTGKTPLKPVDPNDPTKGYIPPTITDPNDPTKNTPVPYTPVGSVVVRYKDTDGNVIKEQVTDTETADVDTPYDTTDYKPKEITYKGDKYVLVPSKTEGQESGKVVKGETVVTYVYQKVGNWIPEIPGVPGKDRPEVPYPFDPENPDSPVDPTKPNDPDKPGQPPVIPHVPGYIPNDPDGNPLKPVDPEDPTKGYVPPVPENPGEDTHIPYVPAPKDPENPDTPDVPETPDTEEPGSYIPYVPKDPKNPDPNDPDSSIEIPRVPYDDTPEDPSNNPPLPHVPGYEPKDPNDPTGKTPLKPVDPNDPTKGYIPPTITDPNDPTKNTPVPYTPVGSVVVRYKDTDGNVIKEQVTDTETADVDTPYDTTDYKPKEITYKGDKYVLVPSKTEGEESGKVVKGETVVTYVYQKVGNWIPEIPGVPGKDRPEVPYPFDPENPDSPVDPTKPNDPDKPGQPPVIPHVPGYIPNDPDGNPLKPVDPEDPTKGYVPPVPENPGEDTHIPYVPAPKDPENPDTPDVPETPDTEEPGSYIPYVPKDPKNPDPNDPDSSIEIPRVPYDDTPEDPSNNPPLPHVPGYEPKDPNDPTGKTPLKPVDPNDPTKGYIPPSITDPNDPTKNTPVPYTPVGSVVVRYKDTDGNVIKEQVTDTETADVDTPYDTTDYKPKEITYKGDKYVLVPSKTEGEETGKVVKGETVVTYVYQKVGNWIPEIPGVPNEERPEIPYPFDPENPNEPVNPNDPSTPPIPHVPGYTPNDPDGNPLKPVDPNDPTKGYIPPVPSNPGEDTHIPYVPNTPEDPEKPDTPDVPNTPEDPEKPETPDVPETPDTEEPGSYIPYVPKDPKNPDPNDPDSSIEIPRVPYDDTPEDPSNNPPLPHVPGYEPKDPNDPTGKTPLKPVDPNDPTKGYIPPTITDPNDPTKNTPVPYTPVGSVVVRYKDTDGNVIKEQVTDTETADVDTPYDTTDNKPKEITYKGDKYVLVPSKTEGEETGKVVKGETVVTYVYQKVGNWIPEIPGVPNEERPEIPYPFDPENPNEPVNPNDPSTPPIPHVPGYTPNDPDGNPLKPVDPNDPTKGYIPPVPSNPGEDTHIPYVPNTPEDPEKPETPDVPNTPEDPEKPDTPDVPNTPEDPEKPDTPDVPNTPEDPEKPGTPDMPDTPDTPKTPESPESPVTPTASTRRNDSDKYMAKGVENLPNTGETSNYLAAAYGSMAIGLAALLASKKRKRDSED